jgi:hypothetical protein
MLQCCPIPIDAIVSVVVRNTGTGSGIFISSDSLVYFHFVFELENKCYRTERIDFIVQCIVVFSGHN